MQTVREIIKAHLIAKGFDGLAGDECGCSINDLFVCDTGHNCVPGYYANHKREHEEWECAGDDLCSCITSEKPKAKNAKR